MDIALSTQPGQVWLAMSRAELEMAAANPVTTMKHISGVGLRLLDGAKMPVEVKLKGGKLKGRKFYIQESLPDRSEINFQMIEQGVQNENV